MIRGKPIYYLLGIIMMVGIFLLVSLMGKDRLASANVTSVGREWGTVEISHQDSSVMLGNSSPVFDQQFEHASSNVAVVQPGREEEKVRTNLVRVAGQEFPLLFETSGVSDVLKDAVIQDIELNLSHFTNIVFRDISGEPDDPAQIYHQTATYYLDEGLQKRLYPDIFEKYFGGAILSNGQYHIIVHDELVKEYERALEFKAQHSVMFERLDEFLTRLRSEHFLKTIENDQKAAQSAFFIDRTTSGNGFDYAHQLSGFLKNSTIRDPSILDFYPAETYGEKEGFICIPLLIWPESMTPEPIMKGSPLFIYIGEKWRIYTPRLF